MELKILLYINSNFKNAFFDFGMPFISFFSNKGWIWIAIAVGLLLTKKYRRYGVALSIGLALCLVMGNVILKPLVARPRPYDVYGEIELLIEKLSDFSFPSGHTYSAFCGATILYFMNRKIGYAAFTSRRKKVKGCGPRTVTRVWKAPSATRSSVTVTGDSFTSPVLVTSNRIRTSRFALPASTGVTCRWL